MNSLGPAVSGSFNPVTPLSRQAASIARGEIPSPRVTVGSPGAPGLPSAGALLQQAVEDDPFQPGLAGRRAQTVPQDAGFESLKDIQRQDAGRARSGLADLKRAAREGGGADAGQARMKDDLFHISLKLAYASGPGRLSDGSGTGLASALAALQPQREGDRAASAADVASVVMAFVQAEGGPAMQDDRVQLMLTILQRALHPDEGLRVHATQALKLALGRSLTQAAGVPRDGKQAASGEASQEEPLDPALKAQSNRHAGLFVAAYQHHDKPSLARAIEAWCEKTWPNGMDTDDLSHVFQKIEALSVAPPAGALDRVNALAGLIKAQGGAAMSEEKAACLVDLLRKGNFERKEMEVLASHLGTVVGASARPAEAPLHLAILGSSPGQGGGIYRPGWLGDWPTGQNAAFRTAYDASFAKARVAPTAAQLQGEATKEAQDRALPQGVRDAVATVWNGGLSGPQDLQSLRDETMSMGLTQSLEGSGLDDQVVKRNVVQAAFNRFNAGDDALAKSAEGRQQLAAQVQAMTAGLCDAFGPDLVAGYAMQAAQSASLHGTAAPAPWLVAVFAGLGSAETASVGGDAPVSDSKGGLARSQEVSIRDSVMNMISNAEHGDKLPPEWGTALTGALNGPTPAKL